MCVHYYGLSTRPSNPGYTERDRLDPCLFSNRTGSVLTMKLQLILLTMGLLTACLQSGKMEWVDLGLEGKECEGLEQRMTLVNHPHHLLYI